MTGAKIVLKIRCSEISLLKANLKKYFLEAFFLIALNISVLICGPPETLSDLTS